MTFSSSANAGATAYRPSGAMTPPHVLRSAATLIVHLATSGAGSSAVEVYRTLGVVLSDQAGSLIAQLGGARGEGVTDEGAVAQWAIAYLFRDGAPAARDARPAIDPHAEGRA